jgi:hypothetical protein
MLGFLISLGIVGAFAVAANAYDIIETRRVISRGLALEANTFLVGPKPSTRALVLRDTLMLALATAPTIVAVSVAVPGAGGFLVGPAVMGVKHLHGGVVNEGVLHGNPPPDPFGGPGRSWFYKFIHNW